ncbi:hypothetical protein ES703_47658 [subsurface metagenome]
MSYQMVQRELETLSKDLAQLAVDIIGQVEPPEWSPRPGRMIKPMVAVKREVGYALAKLEALLHLIESSQ